MYITITNIIGKKRINLAYLIQGKKVAIVSVFSDHIRYEFTEFRKPRTSELEESRIKQITAGTYTRRELIDLAEGKIEMTQSDEKKPRIIKTNKALPWWFLLG